MKKKTETQNQIVDEIIDNAAALPIESQESLLLLAKGMAAVHKNREEKESEK